MTSGPLPPPLHLPLVRLIRDFLECAPSLSVEDAVDTLTASGTDVLKMVHTHDGAAAACMIIAYGSAKDRKHMVKAMKGERMLGYRQGCLSFHVSLLALSICCRSACCNPSSFPSFLPPPSPKYCPVCCLCQAT